ncbi:chemotaxis protein CheB [Rhizobiaceae bacterium]|nr:chemotaxis protein CheB [Rhizobiaceae bacterium]
MTQALGIVVVGCSAGGLKAVVELLRELPATFPIPIVIASHSRPESQLLAALQLKRDLRLPIVGAVDGIRLAGPSVFVLPGATHGLVVRDRLMLSPTVRESGFRPSIDALFMTAAASFQDRTVAVVLSGTMSDGMRGAQVIYDMGGMTIVQDPDDADQAQMPQSVIANDHPRAILAASELGKWLGGYARALEREA